MMAKPAILQRTRATSTFVSGALMLTAIRAGVQRHGRPYSIKSRDNRAMGAASAGRASRNLRSEWVIEEPNAQPIIA